MVVEQPIGRWTALILAAVLAFILAPAARAATITVTTTNDVVGMDGKISLREAIVSISNGADVNPDVTHTGTYGVGDTVVVPSAAAHYAVTGGELASTKSLAITGGGAATTVIDAGGASRVLHLTSTAGVASVSGVTITGGHAPAPGGGAIFAEAAPLTISGSSFTGNDATAAGGTTRGGGALWLGAGGTIDSSSFTNNAFTETAGVSNVGGGAIFGSNLTLTITNSSFVQNSASLASGSNNGGGAVYQD
ncbi:MAG: large repetitive protein, partial [Thermoleophilaceae bacterium]|nr:large repetitive protein [Thermoleophilaceae bacterium]